MLDPKFNEIRPLLTETLPYEVPVNFSNEYLFVSEIRKQELPVNLHKFIDEIYRRRLNDDEYTIPFTYPISRGARTPNMISIVHPLQQLNMSTFVHEYAQTILQECTESRNSLRAPFKVLPALSKRELKKFGDVKKIGLPHVAPEDGKLDVNFAPSYFSVKKYNLLDKFFNSNEMVRLESRFALMRSVDVNKCFFNIYSHSITWAVKGKRFSKDHANKYSFEGRFDALMQRSNYNETNGIVVGPEVSRMFAEVIFQKVDEEINGFMIARGATPERDYTFRRYIDDFFLFSSDQAILDDLYSGVRECLEKYKLYLNEEKNRFYSRPFVTSITRAKQGVSEISKRIVDFSSVELSADEEIQAEVSREFREALDDLRLIVSEHHSSFAEATGGTYFQLSRAVRNLLQISKDVTEDTEPDLINRIRHVVRILFYIVSSDFRVAPLYRTYQIVEELLRLPQYLQHSTGAALKDRLVFEVCELIESNMPRHSELNQGKMSLELCNLLLLGSMVEPKTFASQAVVGELTEELLKADSIGYFSFVGLMFLYGNAGDKFEPQVNKIADLVAADVRRRKDDVRTETELYLILSDFLSCPFIAHAVKRPVFEELFGNKGFSNDDFDRLASHISFVDWRGGRTKHFLKRKRLQPVYNLIS